jgi:threonine dehydratase
MPQPLEMVRQGAARILEVTEEAVAQAIRDLYRFTHNVAEGAGAVALAGLAQELVRQRNRRVAVILTGGNVDSDTLADVLAGNTPELAA